MIRAKHATHPHGLGVGRPLRAYSAYRARMYSEHPLVYRVTWWGTYALVLLAAIIGTW